MTLGPRLYRDLARYYDVLYDGKDYAAETKFFVRVARQYGRSGGRRWLDVACGTGRHLEYLRPTWDVVGLDGSADMLRVARRRLGPVRLVRADMRSFELGARFDVISCLFSAIGHLQTEADLRRTFRTFAHHLRPGGVVLLEPFVDPAKFIGGYSGLTLQSGDGVKVARAFHSRRRGALAHIHYIYLVAEEGQELWRAEEVDTLRLVAPRRLAELLRGAGLQARVLRSPHFPDRGLLVARAPAER